VDGVEEVGGGGEEGPASLRVDGGSDDRLSVELQTELLRGPRHKTQVLHLGFEGSFSAEESNLLRASWGGVERIE
jgi:hypothetical protein